MFFERPQKVFLGRVYFNLQIHFVLELSWPLLLDLIWRHQLPWRIYRLWLRRGAYGLWRRLRLPLHVPQALEEVWAALVILVLAISLRRETLIVQM